MCIRDRDDISELRSILESTLIDKKYFYEIGDEIEVVVLELDVDERKLSLGHKQTTKNPWVTYEKTYAIDTLHELKIDSLTDRGATIVLTKDLSAFVPKKHMVKEDGSMLKKGDIVNFNVIECNSEYKRIVVSHLATYSKRKEIIKVKKEKVDKSTLGDLDVLVDLKKKMDDET